MKRYAAPRLFIVSILSVFLLFQAPQANALEFQFLPDGRVTIDVRDVPLQQILQRISASGVDVRIDPDIRLNVTATYKNKDIRQFFDAVLGEYNHALIWERPDGGYRLVGVHIFRPGARERALPLAGASTGFDIVQDPVSGAFYVRNEVLVRPRSDAARFKLESLVDAIGGAITGPNRGGLYRIILPDGYDTAAFIKQLGKKGIGGAEPNYAFRLAPPVSGDRPAGRLPVVRNEAAPGQFPPVAVFDSGLSPEFLQAPYILDTLNAVDPAAPVSDSQGHGTQMAMIASGSIDPLGTASQAEESVPVIAIQGFDGNGFTSSETLMRGIDFAVEKGARVLSLSWHAVSGSAFLEQYMEQANRDGLVIVAAAGNEPTGTPVYPAAFPGVMGVGALEPDGKKWSQSNFGGFVAIEAPGVADLPTGYDGPPGIYAGTSIATAYAARRIAAYLAEHPDASREEIIGVMRQSGGID